MEFTPNVYPIMYWALAYGAATGVILFLVQLMASYITVFWMFVVLAGMILGAYRNYAKQKEQWQRSNGQPAAKGTPWQELQAAASDIASASQELMAESERQKTQPEQKKDQEKTPV
jgi:hypothetical protein